MRDTLVAIDIETTGLDSSTERIIEIGAVKFQGEEILDSWDTLVNPGYSIPPFITKLTGITDSEVIISAEETITEIDVPKFDSAPLTHKVKKGESFWKIANMYGVSKVELASVNNLALDKPLKVGTTLVIPPGGVVNYKAPPPRKTPRGKTPPRKSTPTATPDADGTYTIKSGDSL